jgi:hypothetical protein
MNLHSNVKRIAEAFEKHKVEYMFIGMTAAILQGFPGETEDIDVCPAEGIQNRERIVAALKDLEFKMEDYKMKAILFGDNIIKFEEPFLFDLMFTPGDFPTYQDAAKYRKITWNVPVMSISGVVRTKKAAGRPKDRLIIPQLEQYI